MAKKQGGKGKQSSQSDLNYWARIKARGGVSARKAKNIAQAKGTSGFFPKVFSPLPKQSVIFHGDGLPNYRDTVTHWLVSEGKTLTIELSAGRIAACIKALSTGIPYRHFSLNPVTGRQTLISCRDAGAIPSIR